MKKENNGEVGREGGEGNQLEGAREAKKTNIKSHSYP